MTWLVIRVNEFSTDHLRSLSLSIFMVFVDDAFFFLVKFTFKLNFSSSYHLSTYCITYPVDGSSVLCFHYAGLLADKLGSYDLPFQVAGGIVIAGSAIPFLLLYQKLPTCNKRRKWMRKETNQKEFKLILKA